MASVDPPETNRKFAEEHKADYPILSDPEKKVAATYGVLPEAKPDTPPDRIRSRRWTFYIGPDGKILEIDKKVSVRTAGEDMAATLARLGVKKK